jgi:cytoskeleton protein RodZ
MNLQELGAVFKQERERRGLSVEDVTQRTKISRRNLLAIEAGRKEDLPHPVYAKGFVKNYARLLDLDPEEFATALSREYFVAEDDFGNDPTRDKPISMNAARNVGSQNRRSSLRGVLLFLLAAAVGGAILWSMLLAPRQQPAPPSLPAPLAAPATPAEPEPAPLPQEPLPIPESPAAGGVYTPPSDLPPTDAAPAPEPKEPAVPAKPADGAAAPKPVPAEAPAPKPAPQAPAPKPAAESSPASSLPTTGARVMDIRANQLCWVNAEVDGKNVLDMVLQPGETKYIHFDKALTVKFGNAGGVKVTLDNKPFPLNAQSGEVRTVTIP